MKYFKVFNNEDEYTAYVLSSDYITPNVSVLRDCTNTWINATNQDYSKEYFTIESLEDSNTISLVRVKGTASVSEYVGEYSTDNGLTWNEFTLEADSSYTYDIATLNRGDKAMFRYVSGNLCKDSKTYTTLENASYTHFSSNGRFNVYGNTASLLFDDFSEYTGTSGGFYGLLLDSKVVSANNLILPFDTLVSECFSYMFKGCAYLTDTPQLSATTLATYCYRGMFSGCTSITTPPVLSASVLKNHCYNGMFIGCTSLTRAPELLSTSLGAYCYRSMFSGCTSLTTPPSELPATTLQDECYREMFSDCTSLTSVPSDYLPSMTMKGSCYRAMFDRCSSLTNAPILSATTLADNCYSYIFEDCISLTSTQETLPSLTVNVSAYECMYKGCSGLTTTPEIMGTDIKNKGCYRMFSGCTSLTTCHNIHSSVVNASSCQEMFKDCTSLTTAPILSATTLSGNSCYQHMFHNCTSLVTAQELPATTLTNSCYRGMFENCTSLTTAPSVLPANVATDSCYNSMFRWCTSLVTAPSSLNATTLASGCYQQMFQYCTSLRTAPVLPAETLEAGSYRQMFNNCTSLNYVKCLATDISASNCTYQWLSYVSTNGTFVKSSNMDDWGSGDSGIPKSWTVYDDTHVSVTGVTLNTESTVVEKGNTYTLTATVSPNDATNKNVTWSTSDASVVTVTDGIVSGVGCGDAIITVTTEEGSYTAQCNVSVEKHVTGVDLDVWMITLNSGGTYQLTETVSPSDACDKSVTWSTSDASVASVTNGLVSGVTTGSATVTVTTVDGNYTCNCSVSVNEGQHVSSVTLSDTAITLSQNYTYTLTATVEPSDAINKNVTWSSSDNTIATVDSDGVVSGVSSGDTTITVTTEDGGYTAQCSVSVNTTTVPNYFTIESLVDNNTIKIAKAGSPSNISLSYSIDNGTTWTDLTISSAMDLATINTGDKMLIKGVNDKLATAYNIYYRFNSTGNFKVYGNAMSLLWGDDFVNNSEFKNGTTANLCGLFYGTTTLTDASDLILPASICTANCYNGMFRGCTNLAVAPELPATKSAQDCYSSMFESCINLEEAPEINLTDMSSTSCQRMFCMNRNSKITTPKMTKSPILRVATGATNCYREMFLGNGNLTEVTCLMTSGFQCSNWLNNCSSTGTFKKAAGATWPSGTSGIPTGWTIVDYTE